MKSKDIFVRVDNELKSLIEEFIKDWHLDGVSSGVRVLIRLGLESKGYLPANSRREGAQKQAE